MKKNLVLATLLILSTFGLSAETISGSFKELALCGKAKIEIDFSNASIHGMSEEDFEYVEPDWNKDKPGIVAKLVGNLTERLDGVLLFGSRLDTPFVIKVNVLSINTHGDYICNVIIFKDEEEVASIQEVKANGGKIGSKLNLIKDGAEHTGDKAGRLLRRELRKARYQ